MTKSAASRRRRNEKILTPLRSLHPLAFSEWGAPCSPLKIGIREDILSAYPTMGKGRLNSVLEVHTSSCRYLAALILRVPRVDLDGNAVAEIMDHEVKLADAEGRRRYVNWEKIVAFERQQRRQAQAAE